MSACSGCAEAGIYDRTMFRGDSFVFDVQVFSDDGCTPQNLTGWDAWFTAKAFYSQPDAQAPIRLGTIPPLAGVTIVSPYEGKIQVIVPPLATVNFPDTPECLVYDVQVRDSTGNIFTVERGTLRVNPDVTRAIA